MPIFISLLLLLFMVNCRNEPAAKTPSVPAHEFVELHWWAAFGSASKTITLNCIGDSVWLKMKETGKETNPLTREILNRQIGPGGQYDTIYYYKKLTWEDWKSMDSLLTVRHFWSTPPWDSIQYIDGFSFEIAAKSRNRFHAVRRGMPKDDFYEIGLHLIHLAGLKDEWSITKNQRSNF